MRAPWNSPSDGKFSWTTLWLNVACFGTVLRFVVGDGFTIGTFSWQPGDVEGGTVASLLGTIGGLYWGRRHQETNGKAA